MDFMESGLCQGNIEYIITVWKQITVILEKKIPKSDICAHISLVAFHIWSLCMKGFLGSFSFMISVVWNKTHPMAVVFLVRCTRSFFCFFYGTQCDCLMLTVNSRE